MFAEAFAAMSVGVGSPLGNLLIAIVALLVVVLVGRFLLSVAWKLLLVAAVVVGVVYAISLF